jgi:hypothetical protein
MRFGLIVIVPVTPVSRVLAAALAAGAAAAWGAAVIGGRHRDENFAPSMRFSWGR